MLKNKNIVLIMIVILSAVLFSGIFLYSLNKKNHNSNQSNDNIDKILAPISIKRIDAWIINNSINNISIHFFRIGECIHTSFDDFTIKLKPNDGDWKDLPIYHISTIPYPGNQSKNNDTNLDVGEMAIIEIHDVRLKEKCEYTISVIEPEACKAASFWTPSFDTDGYLILY